MFKKIIGQTVLGIFARGFLLLLIPLIWILGVAPASKALREKPDPYSVKLPEFKGRIFEYSQIHAGTFTIEEDFSSLSQWSDDGILTYRAAENKVVFEAWKPDQKTSNVFTHTFKILPAPEGWDNFHAKVSRSGDSLIVEPTLNYSSPASSQRSISLSLIFLCGMLLSAICYIAVKCPE